MHHVCQHAAPRTHRSRSTDANESNNARSQQCMLSAAAIARRVLPRSSDLPRSCAPHSFDDFRRFFFECDFFFLSSFSSFPLDLCFALFLREEECACEERRRCGEVEDEADSEEELRRERDRRCEDARSALDSSVESLVLPLSLLECEERRRRFARRASSLVDEPDFDGNAAADNAAREAAAAARSSESSFPHTSASVFFGRSAFAAACASASAAAAAACASGSAC
jgi:hypothetical protein